MAKDDFIKMSTPKAIPACYQQTPIGELILYHNFRKRFQVYQQAQLLIGMCMDYRKQLRIPGNFAFIIRAGGANLRMSEFKVSYAIGVGGLSHIALIGHNHCGMVNIASRKQWFIDGLVERAGWKPEAARAHFDEFVQMFEIENEVQFILSEVKRLRKRYPKVTVAPMLYTVEDNKLHLLNEAAA